MANSLQDQLRALGLARKPEPQARKPEPARAKDTRPDGRQQVGKSKPPLPRRESRPAEPDLAQAYAARARSERQERERQEREAQQKAQEKRERKVKLAALLEGKSLNASDADVARHFTHGGKIRRVYVSAAQLTRLNAGELGVVQKDGRYLLVDREIALAVREISAEAMILLPDPNVPVEDDIPPDLVW